MSKFIKEFNKRLEERFCENVIEEFERSNFLSAGKTYGGLRKKLKRSTDLYIDDEINDGSFVWEDINDTINKKFDEALEEYIKLVPELQGYPLEKESLKMKMYYPNIGVFTAHNDVSNIENCNRALVMMCYLNDVQDGGETIFPDQNISVIPSVGKIVVFPPTWQFPHKAETPISNKKYVISTFYKFKGTRDE